MPKCNWHEIWGQYQPFIDSVSALNLMRAITKGQTIQIALKWVLMFYHVLVNQLLSHDLLRTCFQHRSLTSIWFPLIESSRLRDYVSVRFKMQHILEISILYNLVCFFLPFIRYAPSNGNKYITKRRNIEKEKKKKTRTKKEKMLFAALT